MGKTNLINNNLKNININDKRFSGAIPLLRKFLEHPFWKENRTYSKAEAWIDLLFMARYNENEQKITDRGETITIKYAQILTSIVTLSIKWKRSRTWVKNFLKFLERNGSIIISRMDNRRTILEIVNMLYVKNLLQQNGQQNGQQKDSKIDSRIDSKIDSRKIALEIVNMLHNKNLLKQKDSKMDSRMDSRKTHNNKDNKDNKVIKTSKNSHTACTEEELKEIAISLNVDLSAVKRTHDVILNKIKAGEFKKYKTVYYTLKNWILMGIERGTIKQKIEANYKLLKTI